MKMHTEAEVIVAKVPEAVFDFSTADDALQKVCRPLGPIPGITGQENLNGSPTRTGTRRRVFMTDRSVVEEEVLAFERPKVHEYRWTNEPAFPFSLLVATGHATWTFAPVGSGTRVTWHYEFGLTSPLAYPGMLVIRAFFRRWMQQALDGVKTALGG